MRRNTVFFVIRVVGRHGPTMDPSKMRETVIGVHAINVESDSTVWTIHFVLSQLSPPGSLQLAVAVNPLLPLLSLSQLAAIKTRTESVTCPAPPNQSGEPTAHARRSVYETQNQIQSRQ